MLKVDEFTHEDGRECIRVGRSRIWSYNGPSEKGDVCGREHLTIPTGTEGVPMTTERTCPTCGQSVPVVNYAVERGREVGYLGRHWRPGIARTSKCRGSFGGWVGKR